MEQSRTVKPASLGAGRKTRIPLLMKAAVAFTVVSVISLVIARYYAPEMEMSAGLFAAMFILFEIVRMCVFFGIFSIRWLTRNLEADMQTFVFAFAALGALVFSLFRISFDVAAIADTKTVSDSIVANYFTYATVIFLMLGFLIASFIPPTRKISIPEQKRALALTLAATSVVGLAIFGLFNNSGSQTAMPGFLSLAAVPVLLWGASIFWRSWTRWGNRSFALISMAVLLYIPALFADALEATPSDLFRVFSNILATFCPLLLFIAITGESVSRPYDRLGLLREQFNREMKELEETRSEIRFAQQRLIESDERFQRLVNLANEGIMISDADRKIVFANPKMANMLGYSPEEMSGMPLVSIVNDENRRQMDLRLDNRSAGVVEEYELEYTRKDGGQLSAIVGASPIMDEKGAYQGAIAVISDITKRKEMERTLREERDKAHAYFDFLAHDMANIISPIMVYAELSKYDKGVPAEFRAKIEKIMEQSQRAYSLIQTLKKLEDAEEVRPDTIDVVDLRTALSAAEDTVRREYPSRMLTINHEIPEKGLMPVKGGRWIEDVLYEIIENAVGHSTRKHVIVDVSVAEISDGPSGNFWKMEIADNGPGIEMSHRELLQTPLSVTRRDFKGVGSSLPLCSSILQNLGGGLSIEDRVPGSPGDGVKIVVKLARGE